MDLNLDLNFKRVIHTIGPEINKAYFKLRLKNKIKKLYFSLNILSIYKETVYPTPIAIVNAIRKNEVNKNNIGLFFVVNMRQIILLQIPEVWVI